MRTPEDTLREEFGFWDGAQDDDEAAMALEALIAAAGVVLAETEERLAEADYRDMRDAPQIAYAIAVGQH